VVLIVGDGLAFAADVSLAARVLFIRTDLDDPVVFHLYFEPAKVSTQDTPGLLLLCHVSSNSCFNGMNQQSHSKQVLGFELEACSLGYSLEAAEVLAQYTGRLLSFAHPSASAHANFALVAPLDDASQLLMEGAVP
jgi:hypothetical protein